MKVSLADLPSEHASYADELREAMERVLVSGRYIGGEEVHSFERELADYLHLSASQVITCANGSDALYLALLALDLPHGGEVIVATHNYIAAAEAILHLGLVPIWADLSPEASSLIPGQSVDYQLWTSTDYFEQLYHEGRTVALVAVNMYGTPCAADNINAFCKHHHIPWVEDNAQGFGGYLESNDGRSYLGTRATIGTTSFFPTKPLGCLGDGGAIFVPRDSELAERVRQLAQHGQQEQYRFVHCGVNSRLDALQAAVLRVKLRHLNEALEKRIAIANAYDHWVTHLTKVYPPRRQISGRESLYLYTLAVQKQFRNELIEYLRTNGIEVRNYYPQMLHHIPILAKQAPPAYCPHADHLEHCHLSLPLHPALTLEQVDFVGATIQQWHNARVD